MKGGEINESILEETTPPPPLVPMEEPNVTGDLDGKAASIWLPTNSRWSRATIHYDARVKGPKRFDLINS
jgi:hypothetical protein